MKGTYTRTWLRPTLTDAQIIIDIYDECKWDAKEPKATVKYTGMTAWDIISGGKEAEEIEAETDADGIDEQHEYLVLHFKNGVTATFRNSHVAMFIL